MTPQSQILPFRLAVPSGCIQQLSKHLLVGSCAMPFATTDLDRSEIEEIPQRGEIGGSAHSPR